MAMSWQFGCIGHTQVTSCEILNGLFKNWKFFLKFHRLKKSRGGLLTRCPVEYIIQQRSTVSCTWGNSHALPSPTYGHRRDGIYDHRASSWSYHPIRAARGRNNFPLPHQSLARKMMPFHRQLHHLSMPVVVRDIGIATPVLLPRSPLFGSGALPSHVLFAIARIALAALEFALPLALMLHAVDAGGPITHTHSRFWTL